jgi:predicted flap endonuclease-1-like 5' DNA nuclease
MKKELVKVDIGRGVYVRMDKQDAIKQGFYKEPVKKQVKPSQNKMITPLETKRVEKDDFTEIEGVGPATQKALYAAGIYTFDQLADADVSFLSTAGQKAIEKFQKELL